MREIKPEERRAVSGGLTLPIAGAVVTPPIYRLPPGDPPEPI